MSDIEEESPAATTPPSSRIELVSGPSVEVGRPTRLLVDKMALLHRYKMHERPPRPTCRSVLLVVICMLAGFALRQGHGKNHLKVNIRNIFLWSRFSSIKYFKNRLMEKGLVAVS